MSNIDIDTAIKLGFTTVKKYWRCTGQVEIELDWLYDWVPALATFVKHSQKVYNNKN